MKQYNITGMSCAACQARIEKAVSGVEGVKTCSVSLLTNSMGIEGDAAESDIIRAVENAGYGASPKAEAGDATVPDYEHELADTETPKIRNRLIASVIFIIPLLYVSMGHMLWDWPLPSFLEGDHIAMGLYEMLLTIAIMVINQKFFISGFRGLIHRAPNMDTLVALGAAASFGYSVYALFAMSSAMVDGDMDAVKNYMMEFYFESAAMILTLITVGKLLEAISKGRTTNALKGLMRLAARTALILVDGTETEVPIERVKAGDRFVVRPGDNIPVDGIVVEGSSAVNEAALTGESIPVDKTIGDSVFAATGNESGFLVCRATRVGKDTTLAQIIQMVSDAAATKAPIAKIADRVSGIFVPGVLAVSLITFLIWMMVGETFGYALARAISVLVISCPCALGLATPVAIMVGNGVGAKSGIMFKTAVSLEEAGKVQIVAVDKTGTITKGQPKVTGLYPAGGVGDRDLLKAAYALEKRSEHPLAKAVTEYAASIETEDTPVTEFKAFAGNGLSGIVKGDPVYGGNFRFVNERTVIDEDAVKLADELSYKGETPLFFGKGNTFLGIISVADVIKDDSAEAINDLKKMGIPLAAGAFVHAFGWTLNPVFGAAAMSLSSFCVVTNALRLNLFMADDTRWDRPVKKLPLHEALLQNKASADIAESDIKAAVESRL